ncbi:AAEL010474-PA [Aedes aegypti]|uniref:Ataxin-10 n=1 Tax=Aedes aegypti TaxID=7159 RepID=Q16SV6_AEDAE|nr:AAEL010474-PA [Aedes aegypti]
MEQIAQKVAEKDFEAALHALNELNISSCDYDHFKSESDRILETFLTCHGDSDRSKIAIKCLNLLKRSCAMGESFQNEIISKELFLSHIKRIVEDDSIPESVRLNCLQLLANLCVQNKPNQQRILNEFKEYLLKNIEANSNFTNAATMIVYNAFIYKADIGLDAQELLTVLLANVETNRLAQQEAPEFVGIFLEYLMCDSNEVVDGYERIECGKRILFVRYLNEYIRQDHDRRGRPLQQDLFKHLLVDFKKKSDCVLKTVDNYLDGEKTNEVFTLLVFFADATCVEPYGSFLRQDGALFLNMGCLLRQLQAIGKSETGNMFTPVQKIEEILKVKQGNSELSIEHDISFSLKSSLVKALVNLSYKNKKNQNLARDMQIMAAILECTNLDARNPLIKEWSILAIRNLCDDNLENQKFVASLTKVGDAENSLLTEYNSAGGTIRIKDSSTCSPSSRGQ